MKALFFLNNIPHSNTAGGILYNQIIHSFGIKNVSLISVSSVANNSFKCYDLKNSYRYTLRFPHHNLFWKFLKKIPLLEPFYVLIRYLILNKKVLSDVQKINPHFIFVQMRGDSLFFINSILNQTDVPVLGMIEDTVEREIDGHYSLYLIKKRLYYKSIPRLKKIGVPGETMREYIQVNFLKETTILRPWNIMSTFKQKKLHKKNINFLFAGNIYAKKEFYNFLKGLEMFSKDNLDYKINFYVASRKKISYSTINYNIIQLGWINEELLDEYMKISHFGYLPYIFDQKFRHSMQYAFPGKAGLYITNNLPIFFHGPKYSSFNKFLEIYKVGLSCSSLSPNDIMIYISEIISNKLQYDEFQNEIKLAYHNEFSKEKFDCQIRDMFSNLY